VNFKTKSGITPLVLAINGQRSSIVSKLIFKGAKPTATDPEGVTPLALASRTGNAEIMQTILQAGADSNDGSLHDAARELRCDAMRVLIEFEHHVDYPSDRHDGRSALAELCLNSVQHDPEPAALEEAILCLVANGSNIQLRGVGEDGFERTIFQYALDSKDPSRILPVLLKLMWQRINDDAFLFIDTQYTYSLTKYVEKDIFKGPQDQKSGILKLLKNKRATDRFWANDIEAEQPQDYCGAPPHIKEEVERQKLRRKRKTEQHEDAMAVMEIKRLTTVREVELLEYQNESELRRMREKAQADIQLLTHRADAQLQLETHAENERQRLLSMRQRGEISHVKAIGEAQLQLDTRAEIERQRLLSIKQAEEVGHLKALGEAQVATRRLMRQEAVEEDRTRQLLQIEYTDMKASKENEGLRTRLAIEGSAMKNEEAADKRRHERDIARIKMQKSLVEKNEAFAARLQTSGMNQRQIGYVTGEVS
jgi:hypothetical protein